MYGVAHEGWIVALSVLVAIQGCYVALGLTLKVARADGTPRRISLAAAAFSFALSIWSMHFIGILALRLPFPLSYEVLPTLLSFLVCVFVVGIAAYIASFAPSSRLAVPLAGGVMGIGIASMHYIGMLALHHSAVMYHDPVYIAASVTIAIVASTLALRFAFRPSGGLPMAAAAISAGLAISGMHYVAMAGMRLTPLAQHDDGTAQVALSPTLLAVIVSVAAFLVSATFLLTLVPDRRPSDPASRTPTEPPIPDRGLARALPVERGGRTHNLPVETIVMVQANAHYTIVFDGETRSFCPLSIGEVESRLDPTRFVRVHRSYLVAVDRIASLRRLGDGGTARVDAAQPVAVPVSRGRFSAVRARVEVQV